MKVYLNIVGTVIFTIYGQLILKWRIDKYSSLPDDFLKKMTFLIKLLLDPYIFSGFISAFIASLFWMAAVAEIDLSKAYPLIVSGLVLLTSISAIVFLNENINFYKLLGIVLILIGVVFVNKG